MSGEGDAIGGLIGLGIGLIVLDKVVDIVDEHHHERREQRRPVKKKVVRREPIQEDDSWGLY